MSTSVRRCLAVVAAACTLGLLAIASFILASDTRKPVVPKVAAQNVIVIPSPDQVTSTIDPVGMDWLLRFAATPSTAGR